MPRPVPERAAITGVVLAGGEGRRMGGVDKGWVDLAGRPLVERVLAALRPQAGPLLVSANRSLAAYRGLGVPVVTDRLAGGLGPLAGIHAALAAAETDYLLAAPCDTPCLPPDLGARLGRALAAAGAAIAAAEVAGRLQPLHVLIRADLADDLAAALAAGVRKPSDWYDRYPWVRVPCDDVAPAFVNLNTPAECAALAAEMERNRSGSCA